MESVRNFVYFLNGLFWHFVAGQRPSSQGHFLTLILDSNNWR